MALHPDNEKAIDVIDAMVFSGCSLLNKTDREEFKSKLESWQREIKNFETLDAESIATGE